MAIANLAASASRFYHLLRILSLFSHPSIRRNGPDAEGCLVRAYFRKHIINQKSLQGKFPKPKIPVGNNIGRKHCPPGFYAVGVAQQIV